MGIGYSIKPDPDKTAKALGRELPIKPKHAVEVCREVRGMKVSDALDFLEAVQEKKKAVRFRRHVIQVAHRKGIGPGQYPVKAAKAIAKVIQQAEANAEYKGLETENLFVVHSAMQRAGFQPGQMPRARGRATPWNKDLCHIEIVVEERGE